MEEHWRRLFLDQGAPLRPHLPPLAAATADTLDRSDGTQQATFSGRLLQEEMLSFHDLGLDDRVLVRHPLQWLIRGNPFNSSVFWGGRWLPCYQGAWATWAKTPHCITEEQEGPHPNYVCAQANLRALGLMNPTPVQQTGIPVILGGKNAAIQSYTGSGKVCPPSPPVPSTPTCG